MTPRKKQLLLAAAVAFAAVAMGGALLPAFGGALGAWRAGSLVLAAWQALGSGEFLPVDGNKDVRRLDLWWRPLPVLPLPLSAHLVRSGGSGWVLVDAGAPNSWSQSYATRLLAGLQAAIPPGEELQAILLTSAHPDHTGALPLLLEFFPDAPLIVHAREAPFLRGKAEYVPPGSLLPRVMRAVGVAPSMPLQTWASGLEALLTRPLGWALAPARLAPRGVLGGLGAGSGEWVAALSPSRLAGAAVARITGAGPLAIHPLPTPSGSQQSARRLLCVALLLGSLSASRATRLLWNITGPFVNFPFAAPYPVYVARNEDGSAPDRIVLVTDSQDGGRWTLSALEADTGEFVWNSTLTAPGGSILYGLTSGGPPSQQMGNAMTASGLLFAQLGGYVVAVNASSGATLWQHATYNQSTPKITAYSDNTSPGIVYLTSSFVDASRPVPAPINYIEALDARSGQLKWANFTAPPAATGLIASDTAAAAGVTPLPGLAVYAQGTKLYGVDAEDGRELWMVTVTAGTGAGVTANITSVTYIEPAPPTRPHPLLLLGSTNWEQARFLGYVLNGTAGQPPARAWSMAGAQNFEGSLSDGAARLGFATPAVSALDGMFVIWSNRTSYDLSNGGLPVYNTYLVGRSLVDGSPVWALNVSSCGYSKRPASPPVVQVGVLSAVTEEELLVMDAGSGQLRFDMRAAPYQPQASGGQNSYLPTTTFANCQGQLALVRCLGADAPGSLCAYNGYDVPITGRALDACSSSALPQQARGAAGLLAAAAAAAAWLLLT
ncbi:MBL fold metallo-hydrolase [Micractinium conductrix]|uniref:MBL fold metallo-hydrolase n=1 Tax=Micractinium conductrix TaxID=554055 RepID=A0A2P6V4V8_9CHLO|nr:MBL fold metallo-hydrolase [Micractinium conductrix]|eukprot:PSC69117.1 MBL fold metallo-hydrolase [Micractinium conductrix]